MINIFIQTVNTNIKSKKHSSTVNFRFRRGTRVVMSYVEFSKIKKREINRDPLNSNDIIFLCLAITLFLNV